MLSQVRSEDSTYILISISIWGQAHLRTACQDEPYSLEMRHS